MGTRIKLLVLIVFLIFSQKLFSQGWINLKPGLGTNIFSEYFINDSTGFAVGFADKVFRTDDYGTTWTESFQGGSNQLNNIFFFNSDTGYAVGQLGRVVRTYNGGQTWNSLSNGGTNLYGLFFTSSKIGYAGGTGGIIVKTANAGLTWTPLTSGKIYLHIAALYFINDSTGFALKDTLNGEGKILKTSDRGKSWVTVASSSEDLYGIDFVNSSLGFAVGGGGKVFKTTDGGNLWTLLPTGVGADLNTVDFINKDLGYIGGNGIMLKTKDGGATWESISTDLFLSSSIYDIEFVNDTLGYLVGTNGEVFRTNVAAGPLGFEAGSDQDFCSSSDSIETTIIPEISGGKKPYKLYLNDKQLTGNPDTIKIKIKDSTVLVVKVTDAKNTTLSDTLYLNVTLNPIVDLGKDTVICPGTTIMLNAKNPGAYYYWEPVDIYDQSIQVDSAGIYIAWVFVGNCFATDTITIDSCQLASTNKGITNDLNIYPNPAAELLHIESKKGIQSAMLYNLPGNRVEGINLENGNGSDYSVLLNSLQPGSYILKINFDDGTSFSKNVLKY